MEDEKTPPPLPEAVQWYVLDAFGDEDGTGIGRDLLLSLARRVVYAREVHPRFGGMASVESEFGELKRAYADFARSGDPRRVREEALDVMATCVRLVNFEESAEEEPYVSGAVAGVVPG
jgi:hypothetical protein